MSMRKKGSKSSGKKRQQQSLKVVVNPLAVLLLEKAKQQIVEDHNEVHNHCAMLLEALLQQDIKSIELILKDNFNKSEIVSSIVANLVESKIATLIEKIVQIASQESVHYFIYPWLQALYQQRANCIPNQYHAGIKGLCSSQQQNYDQLKQVQGKLSLIAK